MFARTEFWKEALVLCFSVDLADRVILETRQEFEAPIPSARSGFGDLVFISAATSTGGKGNS
jgi:hypothetical protein